MSLNHIPAAAILAAEALDRATSKDELESIWRTKGCDAFKGASRKYVMDRYSAVCNRIDRNNATLRLAMAI